VIYHNGPQILRTNGTDTPLQHRLRNWLLDRKLYAEIIVEQDIHMIDVTDSFVAQHHNGYAEGFSNASSRAAVQSGEMGLEDIFAWPGVDARQRSAAPLA
jgi:hypothetical protein